jgi:hypothetical protein
MGYFIDWNVTYTTKLSVFKHDDVTGFKVSESNNLMNIIKMFILFSNSCIDMSGIA